MPLDRHDHLSAGSLAIPGDWLLLSGHRYETIRQQSTDLIRRKSAEVLSGLESAGTYQLPYRYDVIADNATRTSGFRFYTRGEGNVLVPVQKGLVRDCLNKGNTPPTPWTAHITHVEEGSCVIKFSPKPKFKWRTPSDLIAAPMALWPKFALKLISDIERGFA